VDAQASWQRLTAATAIGASQISLSSQKTSRESDRASRSMLGTLRAQLNASCLGKGILGRVAEQTLAARIRPIR
jgi:hypothetical protein